MTALTLAAALALGYLLGRARPARRAADWAAWLPYAQPRITRRDWRWWAAQPIYLAEILLLLARAPRRTVHDWQHRNDPPPPLAPAVRIRNLRSEPPR